MRPFRFTETWPGLTDRRLQVRRQLETEEIVPPSRSFRRPLRHALLLLVGGLLIWHWNFVIHAPAWLWRARASDRSDFYLGSTNGFPNKRLVQQARSYLTDIDTVDASGNLTDPESLRLLGGHLDMAWFRRHAPDVVDYNPFISGGSIVVSWLYYPGCQKVVRPSGRSDTDWYSLRGRPCFPLCRLSVRMTPDLRLSAIKLDTVQF